MIFDNLNQKIKKVLKNPYELISYLGSKGYLNWVADDLYIKLIYRGRMGKKLNLKNPTTYNEKLQWLKLYDRNPLYTKLADKYEVRQYIKEKIGEEYLIPLLGVYDNFEEIDFDKLPNQFVLKTTHDSGGVVICKDKNNFDMDYARKKLNKSRLRNYYYGGREHQYKDIKPRIICEKYMVDESNVELKDYKFFCFNGEPKKLYIVRGRGGNVQGDFYDMSFNKVRLKIKNNNSNIVQTKPKSFERMLEICKKLSNDIPHVRVDLYDINGKIYFGELTFHHNSGMEKFEPESYDELFGSWIDLSKVK